MAFSSRLLVFPVDAGGE